VAHDRRRRDEHGHRTCRNRGLSRRPRRQSCHQSHLLCEFQGVTVLDGETNTVIANVEIETRIEDGIAVNAATNRVYVAGFSPLFVPWLTIIDGDTNAVLTNLETETQSLFGPLNSALAVDSASDRIYLAGRISPVNTRVLRVFFDPILDATVQQPIDEDGSSVFNAHRGVVPVRFAVTARGVRVCDPLVATIAVTRTSGGTPGPINEGDYVTPADEGSSLGVNQQCEHSYNLGVDALGPGTYHVEILQYGRKLIGSADFSLR
jgi:hypothetical protein